MRDSYVIPCRHDLTPNIALKSQMQLSTEQDMSQAMVDVDFKVSALPFHCACVQFGKGVLATKYGEECWHP